MKIINSLTCLAIVLGGPLSAADTLWTGSLNNSLIEGANWSQGNPSNSKPGILGAGSRAEILEVAANSSEQHALSNKTLTLQADASIISRTTEQIKLSSGSLTLAGRSSFVHTQSIGLSLAPLGAATLTVKGDARVDLARTRFSMEGSGGVLNLHGASRLSCGEFRGGNGVVQLAGGRLLARTIPESRFGTGYINLQEAGRGSLTLALENHNFTALLAGGFVRLDGVTLASLNDLVLDQDVPGETTVASRGALSKVWAVLFDAGMLVDSATTRAADADGDGQSNYEEMKAGTNPRDPNSRLTVTVSNGPAANQVTFTLNSLLGKAYQLHANDAAGSSSWSRVGDPVPGTGGQISFSLNLTAGQDEFWVSVVDLDQDGDELTDWEERAIKGFDPLNNDSFGTGQPGADYILAQEWAAGVSSQVASVSTVVSQAYEKDQTPAVIRVSRTGPTTRGLPVTLSYQGNSNPAKGSASTNDYVITTMTGTPVPGAVLIPAGAASVDVRVLPVADTRMEVPETLVCSPLGRSQSALVQINDATNVPANEKLLVAQLAPLSGVSSGGSGVSTIRLRGDNATAQVNIRFYGLTSPQSTAIVAVNSPLGTHLKSLPRGQAEDASWEILAGQILTTDQAVLDKLQDAGLFLTIASVNHPAGEISGPYVPMSGSTELVIPPTPPAIAPVTGSELDREIFRFLNQATFGPTMQDVQQLRTMVLSPPYNGNRMAAFSAWIDQQLAMPSPDLEPAVEAADAYDQYLNSLGAPTDVPSIRKPLPGNQVKCWHTYARYAPDQLRRRYAFALSEIFVINDDDPLYEKYVGVSHFEDMLKNGSTGSFRSLLEGVSTHPAMGSFLSHLRNRKATYDASGKILSSPDENFAREVMQLFSIGLVRLHEDGSLVLDQNGLPIPTYQQTDITEMARVFTGWAFSREIKNGIMRENNDFFLNNGGSLHQERYTQRMKNFITYHDTGAKNFPVLGFSIPAGGTGETDLDAVMDHLSGHPSTAPFIIRRLIQRFVTSNPSAGYIYRVTQTWKNTGGNLGAVLKAILLDYEARSLEVAAQVAYGRKKEPLVQAMGLLRTMSSESGIPFSDLADPDAMAASWHLPGNSAVGRFPAELAKFPNPPTYIRFKSAYLGQSPFGKPSVFNWFLPDFTLPGIIADEGLVVPEFQILDAITSISSINFLSEQTMGGTSVGRSVRAELNVDANGDPHPVYNPFGYTPDDLTIRAKYTGLKEPYLQIMDTNGDGAITPADTTFNQRDTIVRACEALVDQFDLYFCSGNLKVNYGAGFSTTAPRPGNPRDIFIHTVYAINPSQDSSTNASTQMSNLNARLRLAAYLVATSPCGMIQK